MTTPTPSEMDKAVERLVALFDLRDYHEEIAEIVNKARQPEREALRLAKEALKRHHEHDQESNPVYFEQDEKPVECSYDLGEAYGESDLCELTEQALAAIEKVQP